jgi:hypothetical protein
VHRLDVECCRPGLQAPARVRTVTGPDARGPRPASAAPADSACRGGVIRRNGPPRCCACPLARGPCGGYVSVPQRRRASARG